MTREKIDFHVQQAYDAIAEAVAAADESGLSFDFSVEYGMGGTYYPKSKKMTKPQALKLLSSGAPLTQAQRVEIADAIENHNSYHNEQVGWSSSSHNC